MPIAQQAQADALIAYNYLAGEPVGPGNGLSGVNLGGLTLTPGVYKFDTSADLAAGTILYLNAQNDANARFDFQIGTALTANVNSQVVLLNLAQADNVYWQVGSSATIDDNVVFKGTIIADQSISLKGGADLEGRAIALNAAVTMINNVITVPNGTADPGVVPEPSTFCLVGLVTLCAPFYVMRRRKAARS